MDREIFLWEKTKKTCRFLAERNMSDITGAGFITTLMQRMRLENLIYGKEGAQEVLNTIDSVEGMEREVREHQEIKRYLIRTGRDTKWRQ